MKHPFALCLALPLLALGSAPARSQAAPPRAHRPAPAHGTPAAPGRAVRDQPFPDVPKDHWAFQAVETLRKAGIIVGEPMLGKPAAVTFQRPR